MVAEIRGQSCHNISCESKNSEARRSMGTKRVEATLYSGLYEVAWY